jgi:CelD/BcsL family acetyltransferase involved in cellulose biosynthesis
MIEAARTAQARPTVVEMDPARDGEWDAFVESHRDASVFHHSAWLRTLESEYGGRVMRLAYLDPDGELRGVLPLQLARGLPLSRKDRLSGHRLSSLPRTPTAGPLAGDPVGAAMLLRGAVERVHANPGLQLQLKVDGPHLDGLVDGLEGERSFQTFVLELPRSPEELRFGRARNHARIRWSVHKAQRNGVRIRLAETERDLRAWYRLYLETMRHHAIPPRPYRLFSAMWTRLRRHDLMDLLLAEHHDAAGTTLIAGSIFFRFGETVFYGFNGSHRGALSFRPNDVIIWKAINDACERGYRRFDLGEVDAFSSTLATFKRKWGTQPYWLYRYYYPSQPAERPTTERMSVRAGRALWRHLPLRGTALLGERIYSYL